MLHMPNTRLLPLVDYAHYARLGVSAGAASDSGLASQNVDESRKKSVANAVE